MCFRILLFSAGAVFAVIFWYISQAIPVGTAFAVKEICSGAFIAKRTPSDVLNNDVAPTNIIAPLLKVDVDRPRRVVTGVALGYTVRAIYRESLGCTLEIGPTEEDLRQQPISINRLRYQVKVNPLSKTAFWPYGEGPAQYPHASSPEASIRKADRLKKGLAASLARSQTGRTTRALLVAHKGRLIYENYAPGSHQSLPLPGSSMGACLMSAVLGLMVKQGKVNLADPITLHLPFWKSEIKDPRHNITIEHLLFMTSGLYFSERLSGASDLLAMLYNTVDAASVAADNRVIQIPGTQWQLSTASTILLSRVVRSILGDKEYAYYIRNELFNKINAHSFVMEPDPDGTLIPFHTHATARDWLRLGEFFRLGGRWKDTELLQPSWMRYTTTPSARSPQGQYGGHFWLNSGVEGYPATRKLLRLPRDAFMGLGTQGSAMVVIPSNELVIVRLAQDQTPESNWQWDPSDVMATLQPILGLPG